MSALIASGGMLSVPGALQVYSLFIAFLISVLVGDLLVLMVCWYFYVTPSSDTCNCN